MDIIKIIKSILKIGDSSVSNYLDSPLGHLKYSNIKIDIRNFVKRKKYFKIGCYSSVNTNFVFETGEGYIDIGSRIFIGALI